MTFEALADTGTSSPTAPPLPAKMPDGPAAGRLPTNATEPASSILAAGAAPAAEK
jgi:hypothetical protein